MTEHRPPWGQPDPFGPAQSSVARHPAPDVPALPPSWRCPDGHGDLACVAPSAVDRWLWACPVCDYVNSLPKPAPHLPGAWPAGDDGAPDGAVRCADCAGGLEHLGRGLEHLERTGHRGVTFVGGSDRVWTPL